MVKWLEEITVPRTWELHADGWPLVGCQAGQEQALILVVPAVQVHLHVGPPAGLHHLRNVMQHAQRAQLSLGLQLVRYPGRVLAGQRYRHVGVDLRTRVGVLQQGFLGWGRVPLQCQLCSQGRNASWSATNELPKEYAPCKVGEINTRAV